MGREHDTPVTPVPDIDPAPPQFEETCEDTKHKRGRNFIVVLRHWRPGDYIRQLSVVVIGILITFQGTAMLESSKLRRQSREILAMIEDEMSQNLGQLIRSQQIIDVELTGMHFFARHMSDIASAPRDSVDALYMILDQAPQFSYISNAFEVMKASTAASNKIDRELMRHIFSCYDQIDAIFSSVNYYYRSKFEIAGDFFYSVDRHVLEKLTGENDVLPWLNAYFDNPSTRNMIFSASAQLTGRKYTIDDLVAKYVDVLEQIGQYTYKVNDDK